MLNKINLKKILVASLLGVTNQASAEVEFGFSIGQSFSEKASRSDMIYSTIDQYSQPELDRIDQDFNVSAFKLFTNYNFENMGSIEFGYLDLGENTYNGNFAHNGDPSQQFVSASSNVTARASVDGVYLAYLPTRKLTDKFSMFGKFGVYFWNFEGEYSAATTVNTTSGDSFTYTIDESYLSESADDSGNDFFFGLGFNYKKVFVELERYQFDEEDTIFFGVGARF